MFDSAEKSKRDRYDAFAPERGATFVPHVIETNDVGLNPYAKRFLQDNFALCNEQRCDGGGG